MSLSTTSVQEEQRFPTTTNFEGFVPVIYRKCMEWEESTNKIKAVVAKVFKSLIVFLGILLLGIGLWPMIRKQVKIEKTPEKKDFFSMTEPERKKARENSSERAMVAQLVEDESAIEQQTQGYFHRNDDIGASDSPFAFGTDNDPFDSPVNG